MLTTLHEHRGAFTSCRYESNNSPRQASRGRGLMSSEQDAWCINPIWKRISKKYSKYLFSPSNNYFISVWFLLRPSQSCHGSTPFLQPNRYRCCKCRFPQVNCLSAVSPTSSSKHGREKKIASCSGPSQGEFMRSMRDIWASRMWISSCVVVILLRQKDVSVAWILSRVN